MLSYSCSSTSSSVKHRHLAFRFVGVNPTCGYRVAPQFPFERHACARDTAPYDAFWGSSIWILRVVDAHPPVLLAKILCHTRLRHASGNMTTHSCPNIQRLLCPTSQQQHKHKYLHVSPPSFQMVGHRKRNRPRSNEGTAADAPGRSPRRECLEFGETSPRSNLF